MSSRVFLLPGRKSKNRGSSPTTPRPTRIKTLCQSCLDHTVLECDIYGIKCGKYITSNGLSIDEREAGQIVLHLLYVEKTHLVGRRIYHTNEEKSGRNCVRTLACLLFQANSRPTERKHCGGSAWGPRQFCPAWTWAWAAALFRYIV